MQPASNLESLELLQGGQIFFPALIRAVDAATASVQLETYVFDMHGAGAEVAEALLRAARRGVVVASTELVEGIRGLRRSEAIATRVPPHGPPPHGPPPHGPPPHGPPPPAGTGRAQAPDGK
jgi:hypothetical protein